MQGLHVREDITLYDYIIPTVTPSDILHCERGGELSLHRFSLADFVLLFLLLLSHNISSFFSRNLVLHERPLNRFLRYNKVLGDFSLSSPQYGNVAMVTAALRLVGLIKS